MGLSLLLIFSPVCTQSALDSLLFSLVLIGAVLDHVSDHSVNLFAATTFLTRHQSPFNGSAERLRDALGLDLAAFSFAVFISAQHFFMSSNFWISESYLALR